MEKGIAEGAKQKAMVIAKKLKQRGFSAEEIAQDTGLSIADVEKLG